MSLRLHERFGDIQEIDLGDPIETEAERRARQKAIIADFRARQRARSAKRLTQDVPPMPRSELAAIAALLVLGLVAICGMLVTATTLHPVSVGW